MKITDELIKKSCSPTIYKRGMEYFKEGRVHLRRREEDTLTAVVDGSELYNVQVKFKEDQIKDYFCTCPYYETMDSVCKHIVATLKQRETELRQGAGYVDENERLAAALCTAFQNREQPLRRLPLRFILHVNHRSMRGCEYSISIQLEDGSALHGIENFLESVAAGKPFKIQKNLVYEPDTTAFSEGEKAILFILTENYQNKSDEITYYTKAAYQTAFGSLTAQRIFPFLSQVDFSFVLDGIFIPNLRLCEEDPDILIDLTAIGNEISLSVGEIGCALVPDGSWFFFEDTVYHTTQQWRDWFMPVYRALATDNRTQLAFRGENAIAFASYVLPRLQKQRGVISQGIEELVVRQEPVFEIYFDTRRSGITAVIKVKYGSLSLLLPAGEPDEGLIIVRQEEKEQEILDFFTGFIREKEGYYLEDDYDIYVFTTQTVPLLLKKAKLFYSERFQKVQVHLPLHMKASISVRKEENLLEAEFESELSYEQICGILNAVRLKKKFYRLSNGSFISLEEQQSTVLSLLEHLEFDQGEIKAGKKSLPIYQALYLEAAGGTDIVLEESFLDYIQEIRSLRAVIPQELEQVLRSYQKEGLHWMKQLSALGFGGILADDMGLGKTLQVIAYIWGEQPERPALIVTPSALTYNWLSEINRFTPEAKALIVDGSKEDRQELLKKCMEYDFIITSYPMLRRDIAHYQQYHFSYCFIDEAQYIKNPRTMNARSVKKIKADCRFALTGTPIENSLMELWSIFDFVMHGYLYDTAEFHTRYEVPVVKEQDEQAAEDLRAKIRPFILRRMKTDVLSELPEKIENTIYAELTQEQKMLYSAYLELAKNEALSIMAEDGAQGKMRILTLLMRLRQICCHPRLFDQNYKKDSGKLLLLEELVGAASEAGHRVLVFSQFTSMLGIIRKQLEKLGISCFYLDGSTPAYERAELADRFNGGEKTVFLISLKAGGTGLNLIGADMVIHYDPWWNPAVMDQASDRAYRIGQTRAVQVIRLAAKGTIEEKILRLQEKKRNLAEDIVSANQITLKNLTKEEILALFE